MVSASCFGEALPVAAAGGICAFSVGLFSFLDVVLLSDFLLSLGWVGWDILHSSSDFHTDKAVSHFKISWKNLGLAVSG